VHSEKTCDLTLTPFYVWFDDEKVIETIVKRDKVTGKNLGYGFVRMATREQAEDAMTRLQGVEVGGRKIRIGWAQRNTRLYVGKRSTCNNLCH
jgi:RNA recognition motif-containing protein